MARLRDGLTPRIERVEKNGRTLWIKRAERLTWRMRLQKGDPKAAFEAERTAHHRYIDLNLPVPRIVEEGPDFFMTEDAGPTLRHLLWSESPEFVPALTAAGAALARFHGAGVTHGRPNLKDICWEESRVTFLDLERAGRGTADLDLLVFLFSVTSDSHGDRAAFRTAREAYLASGEQAVWQAAQARIRRLRPLARLLAPVAWVQPRNREFRAVGPFVRYVLNA